MEFLWNDIGKVKGNLVRTYGYPVPGEHLEFFIRVALSLRRLLFTFDFKTNLMRNYKQVQKQIRRFVTL